MEKKSIIYDIREDWMLIVWKSNALEDNNGLNSDKCKLYLGERYFYSEDGRLNNHEKNNETVNMV